MLDTARTTARHQAPAGVAGLRRIDEVRVIVGHGRPVAEVTGIAHRYPHTFRISLAAASELAAAGVPLRIEHRDDRALAGSR
jgi:hypothetical protein